MDIMDKTFKNITCDGCEIKMSKQSAYPAEYGLVLSCKDFNTNKTGIVFSCMVYPIINRDYHFCGLDCLSNWIKKGDQNA